MLEPGSWKTRSHTSASLSQLSASSTGSVTAKAFHMLKRKATAEKAKLDVSMEMLKYKQEAAAAITEAEALEAAITNANSELIFIPSETTHCTEQYVTDQKKTELQLFDNGVQVTLEPNPSHDIIFTTRT